MLTLPFLPPPRLRSGAQGSAAILVADEWMLRYSRGQNMQAAIVSGALGILSPLVAQCYDAERA